MVAKSYQSWEQVDEPFVSNKKMYVKVINPKTNDIKVVRWYNEKEYGRLYGLASDKETPKFKNLKKVLGFEKGYITIFPQTQKYEKWFSESNCRYHGIWGWYVVSTEEVQEDKPADLATFKLYWDDVATDKEMLKPATQIHKVLKELRKSASSSSHFGEIGRRYDLDVTVESIYQVGVGEYGERIEYIFKDKNNHLFSWTTSTKKNFQVGQKWSMRGTVKSFVEKNDEDVTVLTRCMERR